ncbi:hypothetical protein [Lactiplantibacillus pentosus]|uniref:hypothetical protein n=1 Tax=Lactiplantibacillus pentosus TaxID=1589 RepID=UPI000B546214|nr:hypothetical protein [Lactiplantibacillus pentosus]ASG81080.1 hypothetical protein CEW82_15075 [Lactiplantibacillus pentosus]MDO7805778.1 hypothetical protein [Lactiplantibacillus pentosus]WFC01990.1 hypothetical protein PGN10_08700 [Lactiplantibacillus pentosus]
MRFKEAKIFKDGTDSLVSVDYNPKVTAYFDLIEAQRKRGLSQFIVTSDIMTKLISMLVIERQFILISIDFMNDDEDLNNEIQTLVDKIGQNGFLFSELLNKLHFLSNEQCIDILRVTLKKRSEGKSTQIKVQANGIFFINCDSFEEESKRLIELIEKEQYMGN